MQMSNEEIVVSYRTAASPAKQIGVLAELNTCSREEIREILTAAGEPVPAKRTRKTVEKTKCGGASSAQKAKEAKKEGKNAENGEKTCCDAPSALIKEAVNAYMVMLSGEIEEREAKMKKLKNILEGLA